MGGFTWGCSSRGDESWVRRIKLLNIYFTKVCQVYDFRQKVMFKEIRAHKKSNCTTIFCFWMFGKHTLHLVQH